MQVTAGSKERTKTQEMGRKCAELTGDRAPGEDRAAERHMTQRTRRGTSTNTETTRVNRRAQQSLVGSHQEKRREIEVSETQQQVTKGHEL